MNPDRLAVFGAAYLYLIELLVALIYLLAQPRPRQVRIVAFGVVFFPLALIAARVAAAFYYDPRPFVAGHFTPLISHAPDNGFVSDHALLTSAVATLVLYFSRPVGALLWILALLVGYSRVYVGLHHPIDVLGAYGCSLILSPAGYIVQKRWLGPWLLGRLRRR